MKRYTWEETQEKKRVKKSGDGADESAHTNNSSASDAVADSTKEYPCLMRVEAGKKFKMSTIIHPDDTDRFLEKYAGVMKRSTDFLPE